ncbi:hypothetical protein [Noviherbaspirillum galbum]|uniref:Uncharacterized protein n=1 Tax=Noviherbaspirillum galbum TaxID=2709383 RepID=A0A6B3SHF3_9BURK|nr:hypothetical protein [Noviherbaspirillum galbum]NEX60098.1 hypothetical protein [Noviherbaspirillum galbum]
MSKNEKGIVLWRLAYKKREQNEQVQRHASARHQLQSGNADRHLVDPFVDV